MTTIPLQQVGKITIEVKQASGSYVNGRYIEATPVSEFIEANVQPINSKDLLNLPEAQRSRDAIKIYTAFELKPAREGSSNRKADIVIYDGEEWEIHSSKSYKMGILNHIKAIAFRLDTK